MKTLLLLAALLAPVFANEAAFIRKAEQWMNDLDSSKRTAAYRTWLQLGPEAMPEFEKALERSLDFHSSAIDRLCGGSRNHTNPYDTHHVLAEELDAERARVIPLIRTDWKKDNDKIAMLRNEMESLDLLHGKVARAAKVDTTKFDAAIDGHLGALFEITRQLERFRPEADSRDLDDEELRQWVRDDHFEASHLEKLKARFQQSVREIQSFKEAGEANEKAGNWADGAMVTFAATLNSQRLLLGLGALRLEEKLSAAAKGHSSDMASMGFFAHESPVPGKKTPWDRARKAGFTGNASGENIFAGSASPQSAYDAWFASDGHRFIMMASGPNVLGVGIAGKHWTMMTGSK